MNYSNYHFKKLLTSPINTLIKEITNIVHELSPLKNNFFKRNVKYCIDDYVIGIIDVLKNNISWNSYNGIINGNTLRKKHSDWVKLGIYNKIYENTLAKFFKKSNKNIEFKYQSIDSTFIEDINGSKYSAYSGIYKKRKGESSKGIKISSLVTLSGIPISLYIDGANRYDSIILPKIIDNRVIINNTFKYSCNNRYKQYLLADSGYDSKKNQNILVDKGYTPIITQNRRNIKNEALIRKLNKKQKKIYKKRIIIENYHSWIKKFQKLKYLSERNIDYYEGLLFLGISIIINRKMISQY